MSDSIGIELQSFIEYITCGVVLTFLYDCLRVARRVIRHTSFFIGLEDGLFWLAALVGFYFMLYQLNDGIPRYFAIAGAGIGIKIYKKLVSEYFVDGFSKLCKQILDIVILLLKRLFMPISWAKKKLTQLKKFVMITLCKRVHFHFFKKHARGKPDEP